MAAPLRRLVAGVALAGALVALTASPALAHGRGTDATNYLSTITDDPGVEGVEWQVINSDEFLQVTNTSDAEVAIPGYEDEPYLRIGPDGVFRNENSRATYINAERFGDVAVPAEAGPSAEPDWSQVSDEPVWTYHDHRIHWMAPEDPPAVTEDPDTRQLVNAWTVPFTVDGTSHELAGELVWVPGQNPWAWLVPALVVVSLPVAWALIRTRPDREALEWNGLSTSAGAVLLVLALANTIHLVDDLFATPIPLAESAVTAIQTFFFIVIAVFGAIKAIQGGEGAFTALGVGAGAVFIGQGLLYVSVLSASQTASVFPGWLTRTVIAASLAQIIPLGIAAVVGTRTLLPEWDDDLAEEAPPDETPADETPPDETPVHETPAEDPSH